MANDIQAAINNNAIKNGTLVASCTKTGKYSVTNTYAKNIPTITDIQSKFDDRFDDPRYYSGDSAT